MNITPLASWIPRFTPPLVVAGPCAVESEEQILQTAGELVALGSVHILRLGVWKPRTRPHSFAGLGEVALPWVAHVRQHSGLPVAIEVANARHVELALGRGIDILWIGARTTASPFSVQEIADSLAGVDIPVLVKNPINVDLSLWIGAIERIWRAGCRKIVAVHRGFATGEVSPYRNAPLWGLPAELKRRLPELPLICDPSHIAGCRELIPELCQRALDMNMDGLMVEAHYRPEAALSDSQQQITPTVLGDILRGLRRKTERAPSASLERELESLRERLDCVDGKLFELLRDRMDIIDKIGLLKRDNNVSAFQLQRMRRMLEGHMDNAERLGLGRDYVRDIYGIIHAESLKRQTRIFNRAEV